MTTKGVGLTMEFAGNTHPTPRRTPLGYTVWLTALPSSGKTTLAQRLHRKLETMGISAEILDGDEIRQKLSTGLGFTRKDREEQVRRIAYVANLLIRNGIVVIAAAISPYREMRHQARMELERFLEVYVSCPLPVCIQRDVKGLYAKALRGEISRFTGISDVYEAPLYPDVLVETDHRAPEVCVDIIIHKLVAFQFLPRTAIQDVLFEEMAPHRGQPDPAGRTGSWMNGNNRVFSSLWSSSLLPDNGNHWVSYSGNRPWKKERS